MASSAVSASADPAPMSVERVLDPAWLGSAIYPGRDDIRIAAVDVVWTLSNTATKVRAKLTLSGRCEGLESEICIKGMLGEQGKVFAASGVSRREVLFYRNLAGPLAAAGLSVPPILYTGIDETTSHGLLIMPDLVADGCEFLSPLTPYSREEAQSSVAQLACLHAVGAADALCRQPWVQPMLERIAENSLVPLERVQELLVDSRSDAFPGALRDAKRVHGNLGLLVDRFRAAPATCVHGDAHAGNLYKLADGRGIGVIDWQLIQRGHWALDLAYHLGTALSVEERRASERDLLKLYIDKVAQLGGSRIDPEQAWTDYRAAMLYGYYLWAITQRVERPIILEFVKRLGTAVVDLDSLGLVGG